MSEHGEQHSPISRSRSTSQVTTQQLNRAKQQPATSPASPLKQVSWALSGSFYIHSLQEAICHLPSSSAYLPGPCTKDTGNSSAHSYNPVTKSLLQKCIACLSGAQHKKSSRWFGPPIWPTHKVIEVVGRSRRGSDSLPHQVFAAAPQLIQAGFIIGWSPSPRRLGVRAVFIVAEDEGHCWCDTCQCRHHEALHPCIVELSKVHSRTVQCVCAHQAAFKSCAVHLGTLSCQ